MLWSPGEGPPDMFTGLEERRIGIDRKGMEGRVRGGGGEVRERREGGGEVVRI